MAKTDMIRARMEPELKRGAEAIFKVLGLSPTEAITLFYKQVTLRRGLPFSVEIPNAETLEAVREALNEEGLTEEWPDLEFLKRAQG
jgi:DNA-damage-inducible protein J